MCFHKLSMMAKNTKKEKDLYFSGRHLEIKFLRSVVFVRILCRYILVFGQGPAKKWDML